MVANLGAPNADELNLGDGRAGAGGQLGFAGRDPTDRVRVP